MPEAESAPAGLSELERLSGVLFDPQATFPDIVARPRWWVPLAAIAVLALMFVGVFHMRDGWPHFFRQQNARSEQFQQLPAEQQERALEQQLRIGPIVAYVQVPVGLGIFSVLLAGIFLFVFNILAGQNLQFRSLYAVTCYSLLPLGISSVLSLVVFLFKGPEEFDLQSPLATNVGAFLDPEQVPRWVVSVANSVDLMSFWVMLLLATGIAAAGRRLAWSTAFAWVIAAWVFWLGVKGLGSWVFS